MGLNRKFIITVTLLTLVEWGFFPSFKTVGFHCLDPKLSYKNDGETVSVKLLLFVSFVFPYIIFLIVERFARKTHSQSFWIKRAHYWYFKYLHGICLTFLLTDIVKCLVGEPRPHFLDTCKPYEALNCTNGEYFSKYTCTNSDKRVMDSYKSFPSGHASFSCYTAVFLAHYFGHSIQTRSYLLVNFLQVISIFWALLSSLTRITDHRHHWWDVLIGSILGASIALYFINRRSSKKIKDNFDIENNKNFNSKLINPNR